MGWPHRQSWETIGLFGVVAAGTAARWWHLGDGFSKDEICSVLIAGSDFHKLLQGALHDAPHPPLYYFVLHLWLSLFGTSEVAARALSVVFSIGFLLAAYTLLRRFATAPRALAVLCVFAFGSYFVYYGQQTRPYAMIALVSALNLLAFLKAMKTPADRRAVGLWGLSAVALLFSQYMGALFIVCEVAWALLRWRKKGLPFAYYGAVAGLCIGAWMLAAMGGALAQHHDPIPTTVWMVRPKPEALVWFYGKLFGTALQLRWLFLVMGGLVTVYVWRAAKRRSVPGEHLFLALVAIGVPLLVFALSLWGPRPVFVPRQLMAAAIAAIVVLGAVVASAPRALAFSAIAVLVAFCLFSLPQTALEIGKEPWRQIAAWVDHGFGPVRVVVTEMSDRNSFAYYRRSGPVIGPRELAKVGAKPFLIVCRPQRCGLDGIEGRASLVKTWSSADKLLVYRVRPANSRTAKLDAAR